MKKGFLVVLLVALISPVFSQQIPEKLKGIWEGKDRFIFFENAADDKNPELVIILKTYYGWYYDRAAEPVTYSELEPRTRNTATHKDPEVIPYTINAFENISDAYQLSITFSKHYSNTTSFAIINDRIFLNMYTKYDINQENLWRGWQYSEGFIMNNQPVDENISLLIMLDDKFYDVRYWQTDMDYSTDYITFEYKDDSYTIPKHLHSCETNYSCVSGRSKKVRNAVKPFEYKSEDYIFNDNQKVFTKNEEPYLKRLADRSTFEDLMKLVKDANSRRKPDPPALFPENDLDWHWDLIDMLEKDNTIIQQVRARQKAFGPRGRD